MMMFLKSFLRAFLVMFISLTLLYFVVTALFERSLIESLRRQQNIPRTGYVE